MKQKISKQIENTFRQSNSSEQLFDAFQIAIENKISDAALYKILLANPSLSKDEIIFFTEKIIKEFSEISYDISVWTAGIFGNNTDISSMENSFLYYQKATNLNPSCWEPYVLSLNLFDPDLRIPINKKILNMVESSVKKVEKKSKVYYALAEIYKKTGNKELVRKYQSLAEKHSSKEN